MSQNVLYLGSGESVKNDRHETALRKHLENNWVTVKDRSLRQS